MNDLPEVIGDVIFTTKHLDAGHLLLQDIAIRAMRLIGLAEHEPVKNTFSDCPLYKLLRENGKAYSVYGAGYQKRYVVTANGKRVNFTEDQLTALKVSELLDVEKEKTDDTFTYIYTLKSSRFEGLTRTQRDEFDYTLHKGAVRMRRVLDIKKAIGLVVDDWIERAQWSHRQNIDNAQKTAKRHIAYSRRKWEVANLKLRVAELEAAAEKNATP